MIKAILGIVTGAISAWNAWQASRRDAALVDTGRKLQAGDNLKATVEKNNEAQHDAEAVRRLDDSALDAELLRDQTGAAAAGR